MLQQNIYNIYIQLALLLSILRISLDDGGGIAGCIDINGFTLSILGRYSFYLFIFLIFFF
jgi:hypothetical protein